MFVLDYVLTFIACQLGKRNRHHVGIVRRKKWLPDNDQSAGLTSCIRRTATAQSNAPWCLPSKQHMCSAVQQCMSSYTDSTNPLWVYKPIQTKTAIERGWDKHHAVAAHAPSCNTPGQQGA